MKNHDILNSIINKISNAYIYLTYLNNTVEDFHKHKHKELHASNFRCFLLTVKLIIRYKYLPINKDRKPNF